MLSLAPLLTGLIVLLLLSCFAKCFTALSLLRVGLGLEGGAFGAVLFAITLALTLFVMSPQIEKAGGVRALFSETADEKSIENAFRPFLEQHTDQKLKEKFASLHAKLSGTAKSAAETSATKGDAAPATSAVSVPFFALVPAFVLTEVKAGFELGFLLLIPFLVIDLLVANALMALGITQMPASVVSFPCKVLIFFVVDGWALLGTKLISAYAG